LLAAEELCVKVNSNHPVVRTMARRYFHAHETAREEELEGLPLAGFGRRVLGYWIDMILMFPLVLFIARLWTRYEFLADSLHREWKWHGGTVRIGTGYSGASDSNEWVVIVAGLFCIALVNYLSNGKSVGKWITRTRIVSLTHERLGLWQCVERILGYGASIAEGGLGFIQYYWSPNRMCAHDRLAETVVVDERKKARRRETAAKPTSDPVSFEYPTVSQNSLGGSDSDPGEVLPSQSDPAQPGALHPMCD
jgi:uncharacterized RDD family membrane protein YckC